MLVYQVLYNANPNVPFETCLDHTGDPIELTEQRVRTFDRLDTAIEFLIECGDPVNKLEDFKTQFVKQYTPTKEEIKVLNWAY